MNPESDYLKSKNLPETNGVITFTAESLEALLKDYFSWRYINSTLDSVWDNESDEAFNNQL